MIGNFYLDRSIRLAYHGARHPMSSNEEDEMTIDPPDKSDPTTELPAVAPPEADSPSAETTPSPTITAAQLLAEEIAAAIDAIAEKVPQFQFAHPSTASHVRYARTVSRDFIASMAYTVEAKQELRRTFDPDDAREMLQVTEA